MDAELRKWKRVPLSKCELEKLLTLAQHGDLSARDKIIENNIWIVGTVNMKYKNTEDGFQQGVLGLIKAIEKYNPNTRTKFSTYAYYWVEQKINRYINKNLYKTTYNLISLYKEMLKFKGTKEEFFRKKRLNQKTIAALEKISKTYTEFTEDYGLEDTETLEAIDRFIIKDYTDNLLKKYCTPKEEYILRKIFFSENDEGIEELAKEFNCTISWIHKEKNRILCKIRGAIT